MSKYRTVSRTLAILWHIYKKLNRYTLRASIIYNVKIMIGWVEVWPDRRLTKQWLTRYGLLCFELDDGRIAYGIECDDVDSNVDVDCLRHVYMARRAYAEEIARYTGHLTTVPCVTTIANVKGINDFWMWAFYEPGTGLYW